MKQNSDVLSINEGENTDIFEIYTLLKIKYKGIFSNDFAYDIAKILYLNGIKGYMFFDNDFDIDEIVWYIVKKKKVLKFCRKDTISFDDNDEDFGNNKGKIIKFNYFNNKVKRVGRK